MLDIRFVRENPDVVKENIRKKFQDEKLPLVDEVVELDAKRRAAAATSRCSASASRSCPISRSRIMSISWRASTASIRTPQAA